MIGSIRPEIKESSPFHSVENITSNLDELIGQMNRNTQRHYTCHTTTLMIGLVSLIVGSYMVGSIRPEYDDRRSP
jgi:hypothetical protein